MSDSVWMATLFIALGTFLMRALPMVWMSRRMKNSDSENASDSMPEWLSVLGPAMIAAMFGVSLIPVAPSTVSWLATALGVVATMVVWYRTKTLGLPVFAGVLVYGIAIYLGGLAII